MYRWYRYRYDYGKHRELLDLILSWVVLSIAFGTGYIFRGNLVGLALAFIAVATAFVFHELAHREVARRYGLYARYKAWYTGLLAALIISLLTAKAFGSPFVIAAPGAVYIYAYMGIPPPDVEYRVALAGPLTNAVLAAILLIASYFTTYPLKLYLTFIGSVNAWIAIFNLIPLPPLDGYKIFRYSITLWALVILFAIVIYVLF